MNTLHPSPSPFGAATNRRSREAAPHGASPSSPHGSLGNRGSQKEIHWAPPFASRWLAHLFLILLLLVPQVAKAVAQVLSVKVPAGMSMAYPGDSFPVSFTLVRTEGTPATMTVDFYLAREGSGFFLGSYASTMTGNHQVNLVIPSPFTEEIASGWCIVGVERFQPSNLAISESQTFSIWQSAPQISFTGHNGTTSGNMLITAKTPSAVTDATTPFTTADTMYCKFFVRNSGEAWQYGAVLRVLIDGVIVLDGIDLDVLPGQDAFGFGPVAIPNLTPGTHTLTLRILGGSNYPINASYSETFQVVSAVDLAHYTPPGYSGPLVVSTTPLATTGGTVFSASDRLYVNASFANVGQSASGAFRVRILINNVQAVTPLLYPGLSAATYDIWQAVDIGMLPPGSHVVKLEIDWLQQVLESEESSSSNTASVTITVKAPAISVERVGASPLIEGEVLDFGVSTLGTSKTVNLTLRNSGTESLDIPANAISFGGAAASDFSAPGWTGATLAPGASIPLTLRFLPTVSGGRSAALRISSNAYGAAALFDINLTGGAELGFDAWLRTNFPGQDPEDMPFGDGVSLLMRYATALPFDRPTVMPGVLGLTEGHLTLEFPIAKTAITDAIGYRVEWSDQLAGGAWSSAGVTYDPVVDQGATVKVKARVPKGAGRRFCRLAVDLP